MQTLSAAHFNITAALEVSKNKILSESKTKGRLLRSHFYSTLNSSMLGPNDLTSHFIISAHILRVILFLAFADAL